MFEDSVHFVNNVKHEKSMEQNPFRDAYTLSASEEIPNSLRNSHGVDGVQDIPPFVSFLSQTNLVLILPSYFSNINFNIIIPSTFISYK